MITDLVVLFGFGIYTQGAICSVSHCDLLHKFKRLLHNFEMLTNVAKKLIHITTVIVDHNC